MPRGYIVSSEQNAGIVYDYDISNGYSSYENMDFVVNYPCSSPRLINKTTYISKSPYLDPTTQTWWQYDDNIGQYINTGISVIVNEQTFNEMISNTNISELNNDAHYATTDEDEPLTVAEVNAILI